MKKHESTISECDDWYVNKLKQISEDYLNGKKENWLKFVGAEHDNPAIDTKMCKSNIRECSKELARRKTLKTLKSFNTKELKNKSDTDWRHYNYMCKQILTKMNSLTTLKMAIIVKLLSQNCIMIQKNGLTITKKLLLND